MSLSRGTKKEDGPVKRLINRMPAEVVTFYTGSATAATGVQDVIGETSLLLFMSFIFVLGFILTYITAKRDSSITNAQIGLMLISFFFWSWAVGNPLTMLAPPEIIHEAVPGLFLLGWSLFMAGISSETFGGRV